jgi:hypothetical protein
MEPFSSLTYLINTFGLSSLFLLIPNKVPSPQNLQETFSFLSKPYCHKFEQQFNDSIHFLLKDFDQIYLKQFLSLQNISLHHLLSSSQLKIKNEDLLLQKIMGMIDQVINRKCFLKFVRFSFVSSSLLINLFKKDFMEEIDFDLFQSLKDRLFSDIAKPNS